MSEVGARMMTPTSSDDPYCGSMWGKKQRAMAWKISLTFSVFGTLTCVSHLAQHWPVGNETEHKILILFLHLPYTLSLPFPHSITTKKKKVCILSDCYFCILINCSGAAVET